MRLININTLRMHEFLMDIPGYAILSHTWGAEEVSFQEWEEMSALEELEDIITQHPGCPVDIGTLRQRARVQKIKQRAGYRKIIDFCAKIRHSANYMDSKVLEWAWVDTCCIDKRSSSELSEAINSMFAWYGRAAVCWVYLSDVHPSEDSREQELCFRNSRWFTRGWTLQELLAGILSQRVIFCDSRWGEIGTRRSLAKMISDITGIERQILLDPWFALHPKRASTSERMSWASRRRTTRPEDMAYCLLGIFDVNMPLLYGEGAEKAFVRLQLEIMNKSADQTILAWGWPQSLEDAGKILAPDVKLFANGHRFKKTTAYGVSPPFHMTNSGLSIRLTLYKIPGWTFMFASLNCNIDGLDGQESDFVAGFFVLSPHDHFACGPDSSTHDRPVNSSNQIVKFNSSSTTAIPRRLLGESVERSILLLPASSEDSIRASARGQNISLIIKLKASENWDVVECFPPSIYQRLNRDSHVSHCMCIPYRAGSPSPKEGPWLFRFLGPDQCNWVLCLSNFYIARPDRTSSAEDNLLLQVVLLGPADNDIHLAALAQNIETGTILESAADLDGATVNLQKTEWLTKLNLKIGHGRRLHVAVHVERPEFVWWSFAVTCTVSFKDMTDNGPVGGHDDDVPAEVAIPGPEIISNDQL